MKKLVSFALFFSLALFSVQGLADTHRHAAHSKSAHSKKGVAEGTVTIHFFWSHDCPHCVAAHPFIDKLKAEYPWLRVKTYEISANPQNASLFEKMAREHGRETSFVPTFFICDKMIVGYTNARTTGAEIRNAVNECHRRK